MTSLLAPHPCEAVAGLRFRGGSNMIRLLGHLPQVQALMHASAAAAQRSPNPFRLHQLAQEELPAEF